MPRLRKADRLLLIFPLSANFPTLLFGLDSSFSVACQLASHNIWLSFGFLRCQHTPEQMLPLIPHFIRGYLVSNSTFKASCQDLLCLRLVVRLSRVKRKVIICPLFPQIFGAVSVLQPLMMQFAVVRLCTPLASLPFLRRAARLLTAFARQWSWRLLPPRLVNLLQIVVG